MESTGPENPNIPPVEEEPAPRATLTRSRTDRLIGGVAGGIARHYGFDATLVRVAFVAGVLLWGASIVLYIAALVLMPAEPADGSAPPPRRDLPAFTGRNRTLAAIGVIVLVLVGGPIALALAFAAGGLLLPFALLILFGLGAAWLVTGRKPAGGDAGQIAKLTLLGLGVLGLLFLLAAASFVGAAAGGDGVIAGLTIAAGVALVVSAFSRPARWLVLPALALAIPAGFVAAAGIDLDGGVGEKRYRPTAAADVRDRYEIGAGELVVDLRDVDLPAGERRIEVEVGMGEAVVLVPEDVCVSTTAEIGMGGIRVFDRDTGGIDLDWEDLNTPPAGRAELVVDADLGLGALRVGYERGGHGRMWRDHDRDEDRNEGCLA